MKARYFALPMCLLLVSFLFFNFNERDNQDVKWTTFDKIASKKGKKMVFIELYTPWCRWCGRMEKITFSDPAIAKYMNKNFYNIRFDCNNVRNEKLDAKLAPI